MSPQQPIRQATLRQGPEWTTPRTVPSGARLRPTHKQARQVFSNGIAVKAFLPPQSGTGGGGEASLSSRVRSPGNEAWNQIRKNCSDPLQPRSIRAQPTWRTLTTSLGSLPAGQWGPPERAPGANAGKQRAFNTLAKDPSEVAGRPHRATRTASELSAKRARTSPPSSPPGQPAMVVAAAPPRLTKQGVWPATVRALGRGHPTTTKGKGRRRRSHHRVVIAPGRPH